MNGFEADSRMAIVEEALRTYPVAAAPAALRARAMAGVRAASALPRFSFPWLETAIGLMVSVLLTMALSLFLDLPRPAVLRLELFARLFLLQPASRMILPVAAAALILAAFCLAAAARLFRKPLPMRALPRH